MKRKIDHTCRRELLRIKKNLIRLAYFNINADFFRGIPHKLYTVVGR